MSHAFTLQVPSVSPFLELTADVATRFAETVGGSAAEAQAFAAEVSTGLAAVAASGEQIELTFDRVETGVEVSLACGAASRRVHQALLAPKH
jgi:hypothetical protein